MKIVRAPKNRLVITDPRDWAMSYGTDYFLGMSVTTALITSGTAGQVLSEYGWVTTALSYAGGSGGDFMATADRGTPAHISVGASGDLLTSPIIFGDYAHALAAQQWLGYFPSQMFLKVYGAFNVASADEPTSGFGFVEDTGAITTEADHLAVISSDGTNFQLAANGGAGALTDAGAVVDNNPHLWEIVLTLGGSAEWFIDGTSQGSVAITGDEFPCKFSAHVLTTNRLQLAWVHIGYR